METRDGANNFLLSLRNTELEIRMGRKTYRRTLYQQVMEHRKTESKVTGKPLCVISELQMSHVSSLRNWLTLFSALILRIDISPWWKFSLHPWDSFLYSFFFLKIYCLKGRVEEREGERWRKRKGEGETIFHPLIHSIIGHNYRSWTKPTPRDFSWSLIWVADSQSWGIFYCFPGHISREPDLK